MFNFIIFSYSRRKDPWNVKMAYFINKICTLRKIGITGKAASILHNTNNNVTTVTENQ